MPAVTLATADQLRLALARQHGASAAELAQALRVSVPTLHRLLASLPAEVLVSAGRARRTRYGLARPLRGTMQSLPLYAVDAQGRPHEAGLLRPLHPEGCWLDLSALGWPVPEGARDGWWDGRPYPIQPMRPQGYMGRQFALAQHQRLQVPASVQEWSDDDVLVALSQAGTDVSGHLILGDVACTQWLAERSALRDPVAPARTGAHYAELARQAVASGVAGSSAAGEFPKFTARRALPARQPSATPHVIVKFSGDENSATVRRWSDLLVCEHLALGHAASLPGVHSAASRVLQAQGRTFLETERFDRHGEFGRSPLCPLDTINAAFLGDPSMDWPHLARRLAGLQLLAEAEVQAIVRLWRFGQLIANGDMHTGNLSFVPGPEGFTPAPAYDMLPMRYAPLPGGELPAPSFDPPLPLPAQREAWLAACTAAIAFWEEAGADARITADFRAVCVRNGQRLLQLRDAV